MIDTEQHKWDTMVDIEQHKWDAMVDTEQHQWDAMVDGQLCRPEMFLRKSATAAPVSRHVSLDRYP